MISKEDKKEILNLFKMVDPKALELDYPNQQIVKYFRFGAYSGMQAASEIIKNLPEKPIDQEQ